jgi:AraC-like DNA-binding protein
MGKHANAALARHIQKLAGQISKAIGSGTELQTRISGLTLYKNLAPSAANPCIYEPSLLIIAQGKKRIDLGKHSYDLGQCSYLLTSIELPITSQVVVASKAVPYLAFFFKLDMAIVREVVHLEEVRVRAPDGVAAGLALGQMTEELLAPCIRMVELLASPDDVPFLAKLLQREIIYRLLQGCAGGRLRSLATVGDQSHRTAKAITWLRENFEKHLDVERLATMAAMSRSSLHHHFRILTAMSPLQFQKQLRLQAARRKMLTDKLDAASAAFDVGYESPSQFSREYKRFFGKPPVRDVRALKASG